VALITVVALVFSMMILPVTGSAVTVENDTWYVNSATGDDATADGTMDGPFATITAAVATASAGDTIKVATDTTYTAGMPEPFMLEEGVTTPFEDFPIEPLDGMTITTYGSGDRPVLVGEYWTNLMDIVDVEDVTVEGLAFTQGAQEYGGGVFVLFSSVEFLDCVFYENVAYRGAGLYAAPSDVWLEGCEFYDNGWAREGEVEPARSSIVVTGTEPIPWDEGVATAYGGAIGSEEGGHKSIHPQLGTLSDFRKLVDQAKVFGISIALDIAFQCSPDHPYVEDHPEWFRMRPDNTIQYAENPPKKYQDIYPIEFESPAWQELWEELRSIVTYWIDQGVTIFRVDNPHTKDFSFWEWMIESVKMDTPEAIFLAEAFTRPKLMSQLAKLGFTQSYTYFTWRNSKWELEEYVSTLNETELTEYFRPNFWPNTPDILNDYLQVGGIPAFKARLVLAATLSSNYGIYGAAFELCESEPVHIGSEEYLNSEKYEIRQRDLNSPHSLKHYIALVNKIRRENIVLQSNENLRFFPVDNESIICYGKHSDDFSEVVIVAVNHDPNWMQSGWLELPVDELDLPQGKPYQVHDLMDNKRYLWNGSHNFVQLEPNTSPAHIFRLRRYQRSERDFDYYF
jgi:hypothetical protein